MDANRRMKTGAAICRDSSIRWLCSDLEGIFSAADGLELILTKFHETLDSTVTTVY